jgi:hypothetical protein
MRRLLPIILLALFLAVPLMLLAQEGETEVVDSAVAEVVDEAVDAVEEATEPADTIPLVRDAYYTLPDDQMNFFTLAALAPLKSTYLQAIGVDGYVLIAPDSLTDSLVLRAQVDLARLSTGDPLLDSAFFSDEFLALDSSTVLDINLLRVTQAKDYLLVNEALRELTATAEMTLGEITDTVVVTLEVTYLEQNDITERRLPGNLLHVIANLSFKLSAFEIEIPREALLMLPDRMLLRFDVFANAEMLPEVETE